MSTEINDLPNVNPLATAENELLQVLVDRFKILRKGKGFELQVSFTDESPTIWLRQAKRDILKTLTPIRRASLQGKIESFFASGDNKFDYHDSSFPFRLGNGGTLPIARLEGKNYYCLFFRDSHPTGWNIANGGAGNRHDLLHPDAIIERELREELIVVEPEPGYWHVFDWHDAHIRDHPDFATARELWTAKFRRRGFAEFENVALPLKWSLPPEAARQPVEQRDHDAMRIRFGAKSPIYTGQGFLNINAEDFGIEFDRVAKLSVGPEAVFCDGEIRPNGLLNRVVGLFEVGRVHDQYGQDDRHYIPDRLYWDGENRTGEDTERVIQEFLEQPSRGSSWRQLLDNLAINSSGDQPSDPLDLCPATRTIIGRFKKIQDDQQDIQAPRRGEGPFKVFVSFASEDRALANRVYDHISDKVGLRAFFSDVTMTGGAFSDQIDEALDSAKAFVGVGTRIEHFQKSWVKYEWRSFHNDLHSGRKPVNAPFFAYVEGMSRRDLPRPLRDQQSVTADQGGQSEAFALMSRYLSAEPA